MSMLSPRRPCPSVASFAARVLGLAAGVSLLPVASGQVAFTDAQGREWRQVADTAGLTWDGVAGVCSLDGVTACEGVVGGVDLSGWMWATDEQVQSMLAEFVPELAQAGQVAGAAYTLPGLGFFSLFEPTWEFYTTIGGFFSLSGVSASLSAEDGRLAIAPSVSASYNPNNGSFSVLSTAPVDEASAFRGVWLFRPTTPPTCPADLTGDGTVDSADLNAVLAAFGVGGGEGDTDGDGDTDSDDLNVVLGAFGEVCG